MSTMYCFLLKASKRRFEGGNLFFRKDIIIPIVLFAVVMGLRYDVGTDYMNYFDAYVGRSFENERFEVGYRALVWFCHALNFHYVFYFAIAAVIPVFLYYKTFERQNYLYPLLTLMLFLNGEYWNWMNVMRCSISICVFLYSITYVANRDFKKYYLLAFIALLFHKSSVIIFVIYPFFLKEVDYLKNRLLQLGLFVSMFFVARGFETLFLSYSHLITFYQEMLGGSEGSYGSYSLEMLYEEMGNEARSNTGLVKFFKYGLWLLMIYYSNQMKTFYNNYRFVILYTLFFAGSFIAGVLPEGAISLTRPFRFFYIFQTIMYVHLLYYLKCQYKKQIPRILYYGILFAFFVIFYMNMVLAGNKAHVWYQFFWANPVT